MQRILSLALVSMLCGPLSQADGAEVALKGVMFADYYYVTSGSRERENGFRFRRIYLTHDLRWDDRFSGRVRLEANDPGPGSKEKMKPFVKHAYLRYRNENRALTFGLSGTPTWSVSERLWGYRSISKTIMDLRKIGSSADLGIAFRQKLDDAGKVSARVTVGNGSGQRAEEDAGKKIYALLHLRPAGPFEATAYLDWEDKAGGRDRITCAGFLGLAGRAFHGGIEGFLRTNRDPERGDVKVKGLSVFGAARIRPAAKLFSRLDLYDPSDRASEDGQILFIGGIDLVPVEDVHIMPNVVITTFQAPETDAEVMPRITLYTRF